MDITEGLHQRTRLKHFGGLFVPQSTCWVHFAAKFNSFLAFDTVTALAGEVKLFSSNVYGKPESFEFSVDYDAARMDTTDIDTVDSIPNIAVSQSNAKPRSGYW